MIFLLPAETEPLAEGTEEKHSGCVASSVTSPGAFICTPVCRLTEMRTANPHTIIWSSI